MNRDVGKGGSFVQTTDKISVGFSWTLLLGAALYKGVAVLEENI